MADNLEQMTDIIKRSWPESAIVKTTSLSLILWIMLAVCLILFADNGYVIITETPAPWNRLWSMGIDVFLAWFIYFVSLKHFRDDYRVEPTKGKANPPTEELLGNIQF